LAPHVVTASWPPDGSPQLLDRTLHVGDEEDPEDADDRIERGLGHTEIEQIAADDVDVFEAT
jgi:hypothetical protein